MRISMVVAYSRLTRAIGHQDALPWPRLPTDLARFRQLTSNHTVIMGRKTFESCEVNSIPLANRRNIVLSRDPGWAPPAGVVHAQDWGEALLLSDAGFGGAGYDDGELVLQASEQPHEVFVVGGEKVYRTALGDTCNFVFATEIHDAWPGDTFFPQLEHHWVRLSENECPRQWASDVPIHESGVTYSFVTYHRAK